MIYIDAGTGTTWKKIATCGGFKQYTGTAARGDIIIRWGANHNRFTYPPNARVLNKKLVLDKAEQNAAFVARNVATPTVFKNNKGWIALDSPQLLQKPRVGQMGTGVQLVTNPNWQNTDVIYQLYIPKVREFRAMMVNNLIAFFMEKHPGTDKIRWNEHRGATWTGVPGDDRLRNNIRRLGTNALAALEYDFGAIDIIMDTRNNLYVLEVNSRPEFGDINAGHFVNALTTFLQR